jgi:Kef-type K+ transport system membrane component KefB
MESSTQFLLTLGGILLLGLFTSTVALRTALPRVTLLLIFGIIIGHEGFNIIPLEFSSHFDLIAEITLLMVGFLLGGKLTLDSLKESAGDVFWISICAALVTASLVSGLLVTIGISTDIAIILGCIASATAPTAILDVVEEAKRQLGFKAQQKKFSNTLLSIVAIDDVWALLLFALGLSIAKTLNGHGADSLFFATAAWEVFGAIGLGIILGIPSAYLTGRAKPGQPMIIEALGIVFICGGLAIWLDVSYLIAAMTLGATIANLAKHHDYPFHAIEDIETPFMVVFFVLAGASLDLASFEELGLFGAIYIISRALGKYLGSMLGSQISGSAIVTKKWMGLALLPQAGVPIGMALVAANQFPEHRQILLSIVISSTILFDIIGPILTRYAIGQAGKTALEEKA